MNIMLTAQISITRAGFHLIAMVHRTFLVQKAVAPQSAGTILQMRQQSAAAADPTSSPFNILAGLDMQVKTCCTLRHMPSGASPQGGVMASMTFEPTVDGGTRIAGRIWSSLSIAP